MAIGTGTDGEERTRRLLKSHNKGNILFVYWVA